MFIFIGLSSCLSAAEGGSSIVLEVLLAGGFSIIFFLFFPSCIKQEQQPSSSRKRHVYLYDKRNFSLYTFLGKIYGPFIDTASGGITESVLSTLD